MEEVSVETLEESDCAYRLRRGNLPNPTMCCRTHSYGLEVLFQEQHVWVLRLRRMKFLGGWIEESKPRGLYGAHTRTLEEPERQVCLRRRGSLEGTSIFPFFFPGIRDVSDVGDDTAAEAIVGWYCSKGDCVVTELLPLAACCWYIAVRQCALQMNSQHVSPFSVSSTARP